MRLLKVQRSPSPRIHARLHVLADLGGAYLVREVWVFIDQSVYLARVRIALGVQHAQHLLRQLGALHLPELGVVIRVVAHAAHFVANPLTANRTPVLTDTIEVFYRVCAALPRAQRVRTSVRVVHRLDVGGRGDRSHGADRLLLRGDQRGEDATGDVVLFRSVQCCELAWRVSYARELFAHVG